MGNITPTLKLERPNDFTNEELQQFHARWLRKFPNGKLTHDEFIKEMKLIGGNNNFWEQCYTKLDPQGTGMLAFNQFMMGVSFCSPTNATEDQYEFVFRMFDTNDDGKLEYNEVLIMLKSISISVSSVSMPEATKEFIHHLNQHSSISLPQFKQVFKKYSEILKAVQMSLLRILEINNDKQASVEVFGHQAAGHAGDLLKEGNTILKRYSEREFNFYEVLKKFPKIQPFFASYYGRSSRLNKDTGVIEHYIILEDLTAGMQKPCIMDLKMGRFTCEPTAPAKKKIEQTTLDKLSTSDQLGFRICGIRVYQADKDNYIVRDKPWGMSVKIVQMEAALKSYFHNGQRFRDELIGPLIAQLQNLLEWFKAQKIFRFYGSSILLLYDGASDKPNIKAKMVDFAHSVRIRDAGKDDSYKYGLYTLVEMMDAILKNASLSSNTN